MLNFGEKDRQTDISAKQFAVVDGQQLNSVSHLKKQYQFSFLLYLKYVHHSDVRPFLIGELKP